MATEIEQFFSRCSLDDASKMQIPFGMINKRSYA
jgi:hypothetical protein